MSRAVLNIKPLEKLIKAVDKAGSAASSEPLGRMFVKWGARYSTFARREFMKNARGGGKWKPLKAQTAKRRKGPRKSRKNKVRKHSILIETGTLRNALSAGFPGHLSKRLRTPAGIRVGFSDAPHGSGKLTIRQLAVFHDEGKGNLPQREILVDPDQRTIRGMMTDASVATTELMGSLEIGPDVTR
jgi:hypothetical protein